MPLGFFINLLANRQSNSAAFIIHQYSNFPFEYQYTVHPSAAQHITQQTAHACNQKNGVDLKVSIVPVNFTLRELYHSYDSRSSLPTPIESSDEIVQSETHNMLLRSSCSDNVYVTFT